MRMPDVLKLPVGIESFEEIRKEGFYYIDKTELSEVEWEIKIGLFLQVVACILQKKNDTMNLTGTHEKAVIQRKMEGPK